MGDTHLEVHAQQIRLWTMELSVLYQNVEEIPSRRFVIFREETIQDLKILVDHLDYF